MKNILQNTFLILENPLGKLTKTILFGIALMGLFQMEGIGQTAIYTVASTSSVTSSGTAPSGSSASYTQTYTTTAGQITSSNSATLTLSGYAGYKITGITLSMRSNTSAGRGSLSVVAGSTSIFSIANNTFANAAWNGAYSTSYVNITRTPTAYSILASQNVVFTITGTTNSLYIQSYSVTYTAVTPTITGAATATAFSTTYGTASAAQNFSVSGTSLTANLIATAPTGFEVSNDGVTYGTTATFTQSGGSASGTLRIRLAATAAVTGSYNAQNIVLSSTGATNVNITTSASGNVVTAKALTITGLTGNNKVYNANTTASATGTAAYSGLVNGQSFSVTGTPSFTFNNKNVGTSKPITVSGYTAPSTNYTLTQPSLSGNITLATLSITGVSASNKVYDGTTAATTSGGSFTGVFGGDVVSVNHNAGTFAQATVGTGIALTSNITSTGTDGANYTVTQPSGLTANITQKALTITGLTANSKPYDGNASATLSGTAALSGVIAADVSNVILGGTPTASFNDATVATGKPVTVIGYTISGSASGNYSLSQPTGLTANITSVAVPVITSALTQTATYGTAASTYTITATNSPTSYNATGLPAGLSINTTTGDITGTPTAAIGSYNVSITASNAGGSSLAATLVYSITAKALTISSPTASNKVYDRTNAATITGSLSGIYGSDVVAFSGTGTFAQITVGAGISVTSTSTLGGAGAGNYTLTQPTGLTATITAKPLTVSGASVTSKTYTGTNPATITGASLVGVISPDAVTVSGSGTFASVNVGTGISVSASLSLGGADAGNYSLTQPTGLTGNITTAALTITGLTGNNKTYDATSAATLSGTPAYSGLQNGETFSVSGTVSASFANKNIGTSKPITVTGYTAPSSNYSVTQPTGLTGNITVATLTVSSPIANNKTYTGTNAATISGTLSGILGSDVVALSGTGTFASVIAGTGISVSSTCTLTGTDAGNYTLTQPVGLSANITKASLTATADNKSKNQGAANPALTITYSGFVNSETVAVITAPAISTTAVTGSPAGTYPISLSGGSATNYNITLVNGTLTINLLPEALGNYPFTGAATFGSGPAARLVASGVVSNLTMSSTSNPSLSIQASSANDDNVLSLAPSSGNFGTAINTSRYIEFTATPGSGYTLTPSSITFSSQRTSAGATSFAVRSSADSYASNITTGSTGTSYGSSTITLSGGTFSNLSTFTIRIYPYGGSSTGFWRIDDITLNGNLNSIGTITTGSISTSLCAGQTAVSVPFTYTPTSSFPSGTAIFKAQLSNASGNFVSPVDLQTIASDGTGSQSISATIPSNTASGAGYRIRVVSTSPSVTGSEYLTNLSVSNSSISIAPSSTQNIVTSTNGTTLSVTEGSTPSSRVWKYGTTLGGPYNTSTGITTTSYTPNFATGGTYYVVCESTFPSPCSNVVTSNEVQIVVTAPTAEINLQGNSTTITSGDVSPTTADYTDFGSISWGNTFTRTFTIQNIGSSTLNLTNSPIVQLSGSSAFSVTTQPSGTTIAAGSNRTFIITYTPSAIGTQTATVSIGSDDSDESNYTFTIQGTGTPSNVSTIEFYTSTTPQNIAYQNYQETDLTNSSLSVMEFRIRDGGATNTDADNLGTTLNAITLNITNNSLLRKIALYNGSTEIAEQAVSGSTVTFSGLTGTNVTASDGSNRIIVVKVSFNPTVTDNAQFGLSFTQANCTALSTGSGFTTFSVASETTADRNRIEVTATKLNFAQQPASSTSTNAVMSPSPAVEAVDALNNRDLDYGTAIVLSSTGTMTGSPISLGATNGLSTFSVTHTVAGTGLFLSATSGSLTPSGNSNPFAISSFTYASGDYRPVYDYDDLSYNNSTGGTNNWLYYNGSTWGTTPADKAPQNASTRPTRVIIDKIVYGGGNDSYSYNNMVILAGGELILDATSNPSVDFILSGKTLEVQNGGTLTINGQININSGANIIVRSGGTLTLNNSSIGNNHGFWAGNENFEPGSQFTVTSHKSDGAGTSSLMNIYSQIDDNSAGAKFGNLTINFAPTNEWTIVGGDLDVILCQDLSITNSGSNPIVFFSNTGTPSAIVTGNVVHNSGPLGLSATFSGTSTSQTLTINGNLTTNAGTLKLFHNGGGSAGGININLKGNWTVASGASVTNDGTVSACSFNLNGTSQQAISVAPTVTGWRMFAKNLTSTTGASVVLRNQSLTLGNASTFTVENKATLDFGFDGSNGSGTNALNILDAGTSTAFTHLSGGLLKITSPAGLVSSGTTGNVQTDTRTINSQGRFFYIGKANQFTGSLFPTTAPAAGDKTLIVDLNTNSLTLTPSALTDFATTDTLWINQGIVDETATEYFKDGSTSGNLKMTGGTYKIARLSTTVPSITGENGAYSLTGGTIDLDGAGDQILRGSRDYLNLSFSTSGIKTLSSALPANSIDGLVTIQNSATLDVANRNFNGPGGLNMTGSSLFRMSSLNTTLPELTGVNYPYTLTGGTIELYGTGATETHSLRGTFGPSSTNITYNNIELNATATNLTLASANIIAGAGFNLSGTMNVNSPVCFQLGSGFIIGDAGSSTFEVKSGATFKYGGTINASGATGNIQADNRIFSTSASYGFVGSVTPQTAGTALPASITNLYVEKNSASNEVVLSAPTTVNSNLWFTTGKLTTTSSNYLNIALSGIVQAVSDNSFVNGPCRKTGNIRFVFPVGKGSAYRPVEISAPASGTGNVAYHFTAEYFNSNPQILYPADSTNPAYALSPMLYLSNREYWDVARTGGTANVKVTLYWFNNSSGYVSNLNTLRVAHWNGSYWENLGNGLTTGNPTTSSSNLSTGTVRTFTDVTSFSPFALGSEGEANPLPIELLSFKATPEKENVKLEWVTASEINNDYFTIERTKDGISFEEVAQVKGAGFSNSPLQYATLDTDPFEGTSYYRLKQTDFDGQFDYSQLVAVSFTTQPKPFHVVVNSLENTVNISNLGDGTFKVKVLDLSGKLIYENSFVNKKGEEKAFQVSQLPKGVYLLQLENGSNLETRKLIF